MTRNGVDSGMLAVGLVEDVPEVVDEEDPGREECAAVPGDEDRTMVEWRSGEPVVGEDEGLDDRLTRVLVSSALSS
jgi:hypothetical protein